MTSSPTFVAAVALASLVAACRSNPTTGADAGAHPAEPAPSSALPAHGEPQLKSEQGMLAEGALYLDDAKFRRDALVASLVNPNNTYSKQRLDSYGLVTRGWDLLPEWNPRSLQADATTASRVRAHRPIEVDAATPPLWDGKRPSTIAAWVALGREVFFRYPLRREVFMNHALEHPEIGERVGVVAAGDGGYPGVVSFVDVDGKAALGITCAICHANVEGGHVVIGRARRTFDYGALRLSYHAITGASVDPDLARRMKTWGAGRADVTEDDDEDPVAIPDLWGLRHQSFLTQAGTIRHRGSAALAIRQETQLLHSNHQKVRPPRELAFALAMFLYSLEAPRAADQVAAKDEGRGAALFGEHCRSCHSNPAYGGPPVAASRVGTDAAFAEGHARGTGKYRPPALVAVAAAAPYFHQGAVATLDDVLSPERLLPSFTRGALGKGPVAGHAFGTELSAADRAAIVAYLRTL